MNNPILPLWNDPNFIPLGDPRITEIFIEGLARITPDILRDIAERQQQTQPITPEVDSLKVS
jgi:hypothetical protein